VDRARLQVYLGGHYGWFIEGLFRTFKRTLAKVKLTSRTIRLIHREAEAALLATQVLLAQGVLGTSSQHKPQRCSPRKVLLLIRAVILGKIGVRQKAAFRERLAKALREERKRLSSKVKRVWPRRVPHKPPKPPRFLMLTKKQKALAGKLLEVAA
jgi:hypothetical protein